VAFGVSLSLVACSKASPKVAADKSKPEVTLQTARGKRQFDDKDKAVKSFDMNKDGNPDLWKIYRRVKDASGKVLEVLERTELDINYDGKIDIWRFYSEQGELVREEMDLDFDGKIDVVVAYEGGKALRKEYSQGFDEAVKTWKHYEDGRLVRIERITKPDGKRPDTFELYYDGKIAAVGYDKDGDGKPDVWQKLKEGEEKPTGPPPSPAGDGGMEAKPAEALAADAGPAPDAGAPAATATPAKAPEAGPTPPPQPAPPPAVEETPGPPPKDEPPPAEDPPPPPEPKGP
jgi:hypothetical protein